ncbi:MAG: 1-acyl-sn-glycerol-3-phosphate acyltransferase [Polyangiaceae bacterium]|nr:1-acyl-sn-glycerol-3-phosphate acyltransferase [Polyangiaceae bacterium]MBK8938730.1 1-acyl-sn-glycerol-3-phosphate acyltransferase [Polyangiaceae bacterium]
MENRPSLFYRALRSAVRATLKVFYGTVEATGLEHLDPTAATILACNHPNSIVDPLLLGMFERRQISFCARDGLFKIPVFGQVLASVGAIPIKRRTEHASGADNSDAFSAARAVLERGGVLAIFPEGKTHGHLRIEPLKTGTARIALGVDLGKVDKLRIVPVGVTYLVRHAFRSDVHVAFGEPIEVSAKDFPAEPLDHTDNVRALTERMGGALRDLAVHIERTEDERLIAQVTSIVVGIRAEEGLDEGGQSPAERTALVRRVVDAYRWLSEADPERTAALRERIDAFMDEREELGLGGERPALQHRGEKTRFRGPARAAYLTLGAPFALFGLATSLPPYIALRAAMGLLPVTTDRIALFKLLGGAALFGAAYALEVAAVAQLVGTLPAVAFGAALIPAALFARRYVIETRLHRVHLRSFKAWRRSGRLAALQRERRALQAELAELRKQYLEQAGATA